MLGLLLYKDMEDATARRVYYFWKFTHKPNAPIVYIKTAFTSELNGDYQIF